jgi:calcineurin-like phosphoesterase family protein
MSMSIRIFVVADTHWGHEKVCQFSERHANKLRPWDSAQEMDEAMIELWNETVRPKDEVIHLGDVAFGKQHVKTMSKLNGRKMLIKGNYDRFDLATYAPHFYDIGGCLSLDGFILTHIPVSDHQKYRYKGNIHGHLHSESLPDPWYQCVSVEQTEFKPVLLEEVKARYSTSSA